MKDILSGAALLSGRAISSIQVLFVISAIAVFGLAICYANVAHATTIALHSGAADPTSEGWSTNTFGNVDVGPVVNDQGSGIDAWKVDDNGTALGDFGAYYFILSAAEVTQAATFGWRLSAMLRVVDSPDPGSGQPAIGFDSSPYIAYRDGTTTFQIHFGSQADGDPTVYIPTTFPNPAGASFALEGGGSGYHLYELVYDPLSGLSLSIDNAVVLSMLAGASLSDTANVSFGAGSSCCTGQGNFNLVRLDIGAVPLPAALPLFVTGLGVVGLCGWLSRRKKEWATSLAA